MEELTLLGFSFVEFLGFLDPRPDAQGHIYADDNSFQLAKEFRNTADSKPIGETP